MRGRSGSWVAAGVFAAAALVVLVPWDFTSPAPGPVPPGPPPPGNPEHGASLYRRLDCARCHNDARGGRGINVPPRLDLAGSRAPAAWLADYLLRPHPLRYRSEGVRPRIRMPAAPVSASDARDLAALLTSWRDTVLVPPLGSTDWTRSDSLAEAGAVLFRQYQCLGCHQLGERGKQVGPALDGVGLRRRPDYLMALLLGPKRVIPGTAMKDNQLWEDEARALTAFLMTHTDTPESRNPVPGPPPSGAN